MRRPLPFHFIGFGLLLMLMGMTLLFVGTPSPALAQGDPTADYVGADGCVNCHRELSRLHTDSAHARALQDVSRDKSKILADFATGEAERTVTLPNETTARPFTKDDVAFVIGAGKYAERYVYRASRTLLVVLPAEWNIAEKRWQPYKLAETWSVETPEYNFAEKCMGCHVTDPDVRRARFGDIGVQCEACHGPGSVHADLAGDADKPPTADQLVALRGAISLSVDSQVCGQCHSQGTDPETNRPFPADYRPGGNLLDPNTFVLTPNNDPDHWWVTGHGKSANIQYNEWLASAHAKSLTGLKGAGKVDAACLTCHSAEPDFIARQAAAVAAGNRLGEAPAPLTLDNAKFGVECVACHNPHAERKEGDPPFNLRADNYTLCVTCHKDNATTEGLHHPVQEMFEGITVIAEVPGVPNKHFTDPKGPRCVTCHMAQVPIEGSFSASSHYDKPIFPSANLEGLKDSCTTCHTDVTPLSLETFITNSQNSTKTRITAIKNAIKAETAQWVKDTVTFIETDGSWGVHNHRYTAALMVAAERALGLSAAPAPSGEVGARPVANPDECAECHTNEYELWKNSPHAKASLNEKFQDQWIKQGKPAFCADCHASGYNPTTGTHAYEGVVCSTCHYTDNGVAHPPGPIQLANSAAECGSCHNGAHAPSYNEWFASTHEDFKVDCVDCHTPHNNGQKLGTVNATCGGCHADALKDQVHMGIDKNTGKEFSCVDCHMNRVTDPEGVFVVSTGHSMEISPGTCSNCHGGLHALQASPQDAIHGGSESPTAEELQAQIKTLEAQSQNNWASGLAGGAVGMLIVGLIALLIVRRGKLF